MAWAKRLGWARVRYQKRAGGLNGRCGMVTTQFVATGAGRMAVATTSGLSIWRIRNLDGPK